MSPRMSALITRNFVYGDEPEVRIDGRLITDDYVRSFLLAHLRHPGPSS
jgi:hypothetical protein